MTLAVRNLPHAQGLPQLVSDRRREGGRFGRKEGGREGGREGEIPQSDTFLSSFVSSLFRR